jgi:hypothetical protein
MIGRLGLRIQKQKKKRRRADGVGEQQKMEEGIEVDLGRACISAPLRQ